MSLLTFERSGSKFKVIFLENDPPAKAMTKCQHSKSGHWPKVGYMNLRVAVRLSGSALAAINQLLYASPGWYLDG